jgi:hypothetical protein
MLALEEAKRRRVTDAPCFAANVKQYALTRWVFVGVSRTRC